MSSDLVIRFENDEVRETFCGWMCDGGGEFNMFDAFECNGIEVSRVQYHPEDEQYSRSDRRRYGKYLGMTDENGKTMIIVK